MAEIQQPDPQQMKAEAKHILAQAEQAGVTLRLIGALAYEYQCPKFNHLRQAMGRALSDLDFAALSSQWQNVVNFMEGLSYHFDDRRAMLHGNDRVIFFHPQGFRVDVFFDRLDMCHAVDFQRRLDLDPLTLSLADLLLEKLQIVELTQKDVIDTLILLREHESGEGDSAIDASYIAKRFSSDWGFYYTATENLMHIRDQALDQFEPLGAEDRAVVRQRIDRLLERIEVEPKSMKWRLRAAIGSRIIWYKHVGDLER